MSVLTTIGKKGLIRDMCIRHDVNGARVYPCNLCPRKVDSFKPMVPRKEKTHTTVDMYMCFGGLGKNDLIDVKKNSKASAFYNFSLVKTALALNGHSLKRTIVWSTVLCSDVGVDLEYLKPTTEVINLCSTYVKHDISLHKPEVVLLFGLEALHAFTENKTITVAEARLQIIKFSGIPVLVTHHPNYIAHSGGVNSKHWDRWVKDIDNAYTYMDIPF